MVRIPMFWLALPLAAAACTMRPTDLPVRSSRLAEVTINEIKDQDYQSLQVKIVVDADRNKIIADEKLERSKAGLSVKMKPGRYFFTIHYFKDSSIVLSTDFCAKAQDAARSQQLLGGRNEVTLAVCTKQGAVVTPPANPNPPATPVGSGEANVKITTVLKKPDDQTPVTTGPTPADVPVPSPSGDANLTGDEGIGKALYAKSCAGCHGADGSYDQPKKFKGLECDTCKSAASFRSTVRDSMPKSAPGSCDDQCALNITTYVFRNFK